MPLKDAAPVRMPPSGCHESAPVAVAWFPFPELSVALVPEDFH